NGAKIEGASLVTYVTPPTTAGDSGSRFAVVVTNGFGTVTSNPAMLTVSAAVLAPAPAITAQPVGQTVTVGNTASFSVVATGTAPLNYQWQKNGTAIAGATASGYTTPATASADDDATFTVTITDSDGAITSHAAMLTVIAAAVAPAILTQPAAQTVTAGSTAAFSVAATGTSPLTYLWKK